MIELDGELYTGSTPGSYTSLDISYPLYFGKSVKHFTII